MQDIQKALDKAIQLHEVGSTAGGYTAGGKIYENYMYNAAWEAFKGTMSPAARESFSAGGGKEMEKHAIKGQLVPPKMASYGSSSRIFYNLMKDWEKQGLEFEKKLPTTLGGIANLDGFMESNDTCFFMEAKCREPYGPAIVQVTDAYVDLYKKLKTIRCEMFPERASDREVRTLMLTRFSVYVNDQRIRHFDMKQMICHLLGIATAYLTRVYDKKIHFIYFIYNPTRLTFENDRYENRIRNIYNEVCAYPFMSDHGALFRELFYEILCYLQNEKHLGELADARAIADKFSFCVCDQNTDFSQILSK